MKKIISLILILSILFTSGCFINASAMSVSINETSKTGQKELEKVAEKFLSKVSSNMTTYEKVLYAYLKVIKTNYEKSEKNTYTAHGALVDGFAQCEGKANGFSYLLNKLKIPNKFVCSDSINHGWNLVKMDDGKWYHCDPTTGMLDLFLVGNKTLYKDMIFYDAQDWYVRDVDSPKQVKASNTDYKGPDGQITLTDGTKVMLHSCHDITFVDGWFYYTVLEKYTESEKIMYKIEEDSTVYGVLKKTQNDKVYNVVEPKKLLKQTNGYGLFNIGTVCVNTIYFYYNEHIFKPKTCAVSTYNIATGEIKNLNIAITKKQIDSSGLSTLSGKYTLITVACHNSINQDVAPTYSNYGTNGRLVCKDCNEVVVTGSRVSPLKIKNKPSVKYSTIKKGKVTLKFTNKYYKETSVNTLYKKSGGYQIQYRRNGTKKWTTKTVFSSKKSVTKILKLKSKTKYEIRVRYVTTIESDGYYGRKNQTGPWSKIKTVKVK